ncbi:MAG: hypothetical protein JXB39_16630 [Deltaproteobacteria bacterium]|nr:hypothetical protein [Deltaproteobacteria bacterium]
MRPQDDDRRARDILHDLEPRSGLGASLTRRVGIRGWGRAPIVSCSARIFLKYELADPWAGDRVETPVGLGPVALRLDERQRIPQHGRMPKPAAPPTPEAAPAAPEAATPPVPPKPARPPPRKEPATAEVPAPGRHLPPVVTPRHVATADRPKGSARIRLKPTRITAPRVRILEPATEDLGPSGEPVALDPVQAGSPPTPPVPAAAARSDAALAPQPAVVPPATVGLDDLFSSGALAGRDRRAGGRVTEPTGARKPRVYSQRPAPAEDSPKEPDQPGNVRTTTPRSRSR